MDPSGPPYYHRGRIVNNPTPKQRQRFEKRRRRVMNALNRSHNQHRLNDFGNGGAYGSVGQGRNQGVAQRPSKSQTKVPAKDLYPGPHLAGGQPFAINAAGKHPKTLQERLALATPEATAAHRQKGLYHHVSPEARKRDQRRLEIMIKRGWIDPATTKPVPVYLLTHHERQFFQNLGLLPYQGKQKDYSKLKALNYRYKPGEQVTMRNTPGHTPKGEKAYPVQKAVAKLGGTQRRNAEGLIIDDKYDWQPTSGYKPPGKSKGGKPQKPTHGRRTGALTYGGNPVTHPPGGHGPPPGPSFGYPMLLGGKHHRGRLPGRPNYGRGGRGPGHLPPWFLEFLLQRRHHRGRRSKHHRQPHNAHGPYYPPGGSAQ